ncbi:hypothetical protein RSAG8_10408, partial [Rhizoctonia solani AG-8 WAC10335]
MAQHDIPSYGHMVTPPHNGHPHRSFGTYLALRRSSSLFLGRRIHVPTCFEKRLFSREVR